MRVDDGHVERRDHPLVDAGIFGPEFSVPSRAMHDAQFSSVSLAYSGELRPL